MVRRKTRLPKMLAAVVAAGALVAAAGCTMPNSHVLTQSMPGLADVRVLGPKGQKCYDFCAVSHAECQHMCPHTSKHEDFDCADDCETDVKHCLAGCPELQRPHK